MIDPSALDDPSRLTAHDPGGMLGVVASSAQQWRDGFARARSVEVPPWDPDAVCVCGMGGSGISGDLLAALAATRARVPVVVHKGFELPAWVGQRALVVVASYSGDTEEALACFTDAAHRGARIVVVAGGGELASRARDGGVPISDPGTGLMPRAALPSLAAATLVIGERAGLLPDLPAQEPAMFEAIATGLTLWGPDVPAASNDAKRLAAACVAASSAPHIWGQEGVLSVAAMRWKCQLNENAKMNASWAVAPESFHNEIVPLGDAGVVVMLRSEVEEEPLARRLGAIAGGILGDVAVHDAPALGTADLAVFASAVLFGDFVSVYCAALRGVDPTPIEPIARLKRSLA